MASVNKQQTIPTDGTGHDSNVQLQNPVLSDPAQAPLAYTPEICAESATVRNATKQYCGKSKKQERIFVCLAILSVIVSVGLVTFIVVRRVQDRDQNQDITDQPFTASAAKDEKEWYRQLAESCRHTTRAYTSSNSWNDKIGDLNTIYLPDKTTRVQIYCDASDGGGWIVIQYRSGPAGTSFDNQWQSYEDGFGDANGYWMGLKLIHDLTSAANFELRIDMKDYCDNTNYMDYSHFEIGGSDEKYKLSIIKKISSHLSDSLASSNGKEFSISKRNRSCPASGGWWFSQNGFYEKCRDTNLNGQNYQKDEIHYYCGGFLGLFTSLHCDCVNDNYKYGTPYYKRGSFWEGFGSGSKLIRATKMRIRPTMV